MITNGHHSRRMCRPGTAIRALAAGVFLVLELPLLLPVIVGATVTMALVWVQAGAGRLRRRGG